MFPRLPQSYRGVCELLLPEGLSPPWFAWLLEGG